MVSKAKRKARRKIVGFSLIILAIVTFSITFLSGTTFSILQNNLVVDEGSLCKASDVGGSSGDPNCSKELLAHVEAPSEAESATLTLFPRTAYSQKASGSYDMKILNHETGQYDIIERISFTCPSDGDCNYYYNYIVGEKPIEVGEAGTPFTDWGQCQKTRVRDRYYCSGIRFEADSKYIAEDGKTISFKFDTSHTLGRIPDGRLAYGSSDGMYLQSVNAEWVLKPQVDEDSGTATPSEGTEEESSSTDVDYQSPKDLRDPEEGISNTGQIIGGSIGGLLLIIGAILLL